MGGWTRPRCAYASRSTCAGTISFRREVRCSASSPAAPTRPASGTRSARSATGSALHVNHRLRGAESDEDARFCREAFGAEVVDAAAPAGSEAELRDLRYAVAAGPAARDGAHRLRPGRDDPHAAGIKRGHDWNPGAARRRRRPPAPHRLARRDRGVLPGRGAVVPARRVERGHAARPDPPRDRPAAPAAASGRRAEHPREPRSAGGAAAARRAGARRPASPPPRARSASTSATASWRCASTTRSGSSGRRFPWTARSAGAAGCFRRAARAFASAAGGRATGWRGGRRRFRISSWMRRCRARTARPGRSSCSATRSSACLGSRPRRAGRTS